MFGRKSRKGTTATVETYSAADFRPHVAFVRSHFSHGFGTHITFASRHEAEAFAAQQRAEFPASRVDVFASA